MSYDNNIGPLGKTSVSALFDNHADAQRAVDRLVAAGIPESHIQQVAGGSGTATTASHAGDEDRQGFWNSLGDFLFPDEDRYTYAEGLSRGGCLVTVSGVSGGEYETALDILDEEGSVNLDERAESWRSEGWGGYEASSYASGSTASAYGTRACITGDLDSPYIDKGSVGADASLQRTGELHDNETIPVVEERIRIGKRETSHGRVRVRAYTVEEPVNESVDLREERVEIERRPVDREVTSADAAFQDRTIEAEEYREEAVVQKEARVVEEIGLRKTSDIHTETVSDTVRRTEVEVEDDRTGLDRDTLTGGTRRDDLDRDKI